jgi:hypothetical protein
VTTLCRRDVAHAVHFYTQQLGFELKQQHIQRLDPDDNPIALVEPAPQS